MLDELNRLFELLLPKAAIEWPDAEIVRARSFTPNGLQGGITAIEGDIWLDISPDPTGEGPWSVVLYRVAYCEECDESHTEDELHSEVDNLELGCRVAVEMVRLWLDEGQTANGPTTPPWI